MNKDNNLGRVLALLSLTLLMSFGLYSLPDTLFGYKIKKVDLLSDFKVKEEKLSLDSLKQQLEQADTLQVDSVALRDSIMRSAGIDSAALALRDSLYKAVYAVQGADSLENLESVIDEHCKVLILCNPHNPGGVVWKKDTLVKLAEVCAKHNILVISDEIHAEMAYPQYTHHPFAMVSETAANCSITFMAPSKTFNIAGIVTSYSIIPNAEIREKFYSFMEAGEFNAGTIFAYTATEAAYTYGAEWLQQMRMYITENVRFVDEYCKSKLPKIKVYPPQASFLVWLDCRDLKLSQPELVSLFQDKAGLLLNDGSMFGPGGEGHMRLNIGCPRSVLSSALDALKKAIDKK